MVGRGRATIEPRLAERPRQLERPDEPVAAERRAAPRTRLLTRSPDGHLHVTHRQIERSDQRGDRREQRSELESGTGPNRASTAGGEDWVLRNDVAGEQHSAPSAVRWGRWSCVVVDVVLVVDVVDVVVVVDVVLVDASSDVDVVLPVLMTAVALVDVVRPGIAGAAMAATRGTADAAAGGGTIDADSPATDSRSTGPITTAANRPPQAPSARHKVSPRPYGVTPPNVPPAPARPADPPLHGPEPVPPSTNDHQAPRHHNAYESRLVTSGVPDECERCL